MIKTLKLWMTDCAGATAIEYALIASGIVLTIVATVYALGDVIHENLWEPLLAIF